MAAMAAVDMDEAGAGELPESTLLPPAPATVQRVGGGAVLDWREADPLLAAAGGRDVTRVSAVIEEDMAVTPYRDLNSAPNAASDCGKAKVRGIEQLKLRVVYSQASAHHFM